MDTSDVLVSPFFRVKKAQCPKSVVVPIDRPPFSFEESRQEILIWERECRDLVRSLKEVNDCI